MSTRWLRRVYETGVEPDPRAGVMRLYGVEDDAVEWRYDLPE